MNLGEDFLAYQSKGRKIPILIKEERAPFDWSKKSNGVNIISKKRSGLSKLDFKNYIPFPILLF